MAEGGSPGGEVAGNGAGGNAGDRATGEADPALRSWNICGVGGNCRFCKV